MVLNPYTALHTIGSHSSLDGTVEAAEAERVLATIAWEVSDLSSQADAPEDLDGFIASARRWSTLGWSGSTLAGSATWFRWRSRTCDPLTVQRVGLSVQVAAPVPRASEVCCVPLRRSHQGRRNRLR